ncbi:PucR family transcriptional regulator ligand-binding domain-containing protein [Anaerocolumna sp. AGMB13020]|uniref:PucR family transcriptional regulator n=1 Tax=Anaerocolumna sp. AGMB13020 TaxID=3081750 RepID=UPI002953469B|nr:PucR family transcriptional regulator ligand-binding domain-containing protein [Anaerocolumna sp. AGMB13020]WOO38131.1 PucR family transcriptional regulator ligand-binding domain-containing protein [Anaerocolumna sp. AGMB13020]
MAVRFWEMYEETREQFKLNIVAGKAGMDTVVSWVHMLEDETIVSRFHGEELAITTGMKADQPDWLLKVVREMSQEDCAGIIINTGMYLERIPEEVIEWCNEHNFPILEMPWEISITELIQDYCMRIIDQKQFEKKISNAFREVIQGRFKEADVRQVLGERYDIEGTFQAFCIYVKKTMEDELSYNQAVIKLENLFGLWKGNDKINASYGLIRMEDFLVLILNNRKEKYYTELPELILQSFAAFSREKRFYLGIGPRVIQLENLPTSYKRARTAMKMSLGTGREMVDFEEMGFFKLLFSIEDTDILVSYAYEILGPLEEYDLSHGSAYVDTLRSYIKNDRSLIRVAEDTFTHRNTVNYRIQNIKRILKCELKDSEELFPYQVAFYIRDMSK